ncbi:uncharacterized protein [Procambarus clarkii]|uniref:uncharacterized protein n=1 Tax=Procambarus clarkii TaxID=6728 RepID=UPI001E671E46|nr:uncharacterized protein LOC123751002 [Procambarus clarkii]
MAYRCVRLQVWRVVGMVAAAALCAEVAEAAINMEDTIRDVFEGLPEGQQGRFFIHYDHAKAFNTSIAFTLPFFSFLQPGVSEFEAAGLNPYSFGILGILSWFMLGAVGVAIYTTGQDTSGRQNSKGQDFQESLLSRLVVESVSRLPDVLYATSCAKQVVCGAHADGAQYGLLALLFRLLVPYSPDTPEEQLTEFQKAARYGQEDGSDCPYEYPCVVQPLDLLLYIYDYCHDDPRAVGRPQRQTYTVMPDWRKSDSV